MSAKFDDVTVESDTWVKVNLEAKLDEYDVLYQQWVWDGILGESFIFVTSDVAAMGDDDLKAFARTSPMVKPESSMTLGRGDAYTFVNFNFASLDDD
ncbi:MAG: hypothetical protein QE267_03875 [Akkermansiaceae bacterium]|jgi:hypothetical protein|nr:hypothetical protein [Akkermansiaceae bacterium]